MSIQEVVKADILHCAKEIFFPNGISKMGRLEDFEFDIKDFTQEVIKEKQSVRDMYEKTRLPLIRFYLSTRLPDLKGEDIDIPTKEQVMSSKTDNDTSTHAMPSVMSNEVPSIMPNQLPNEFMS